MGIRWISREERKVINQLADRASELAVATEALNDGARFKAGIYWLVDARPVGTWKGNEWAVLWSDLRSSGVEWYPTRESADVRWHEIEVASSRQSANT